MNHQMPYAPICLFLLLLNAASVFALDSTVADRITARKLPRNLESLRLENPIKTKSLLKGVLDRSLQDASGKARVVIQLASESGADAILRGAASSKAQVMATAQQNAILSRMFQFDSKARVLGRVQLILNAVFVEADARALRELAKDPRVLRISPLRDYRKHLSETVPYIGASAVHAAGFDGNGIKVAVLDSGIDYLHAALGGSGNPAEYENNDPNLIEAGSFPTAKVVGGYDFVGSRWAGGPSGPAELPDPDPLDDGPASGHGTHVAHIIGGRGGIAPGVALYAVKVCSSVSTACSAIALLQGMEFALDPNRDGRVDDRVDIINLSLGSDYTPPFDDPFSLAVLKASLLGVLTVASAGNGFDKPYIVGAPASAAPALAVADTSVPSAKLQKIQATAPTSIAGEYHGVFQSWSDPLSRVIQAPVQYGDGVGGNLNGCESFQPGSLNGKIVLVDRGDCNFSLKIQTIGEAGGLIGLIGLVSPGEPFDGGDGGERPIVIPGFMISQEAAQRFKNEIPNTMLRFDPAAVLPLGGTMAGTSSRGPQHEEFTLIKPEIGAPGASVSAIAGTGTQEAPFSGTSGAAPMITGAAALLLQKHGGSSRSVSGPGLAPIEVKALLMNNAETNITNDVLTGDLAPITRIGSGEVRVDRALTAPVAAWDTLRSSAALSFGFVDVANPTPSLTRTIRIHNFGNERHSYRITPTFRFAEDEASRAIRIEAPATIEVDPGDSEFTVKMTILGSRLPDNFMNSGNQGNSAAALNANEFDGYLLLSSDTHRMQIPWHVLPRKDARVVPSSMSLTRGAFPQVIALNNTGVGTAQNDAYSLIALSANKPEGVFAAAMPTPDIRAVGVNTFPVAAGVCSPKRSFVWAFAINSWESQQHLLPVSHAIYLDTNQDDRFDYAVYNFDLSFSSSTSDGRQSTFVENLTTREATAFFFTEHAMNSGNTVLYLCAEQAGLTLADILRTQVNIAVEAFDWYFGGPGDLIANLTVTPFGEQYVGVPVDVPPGANLPNALLVNDFGYIEGNTQELGVLLFTNGDRGAGRHGGAIKAREALVFRVR